MKQDVSENWRRYTLFGKKDTTLFHNRYGAMASFCRFSPHNSQPSQPFEAWFKLQYGMMSYKTARDYDQFKIFYGFNKKPFIAQVYIGEEMIDADMVPVANQLNVMEWGFEKTPANLMVRLKGQDSPDVYALSFESKKGVIIDNIPMRGSSGLVFTKMDKELLKKMYGLLGPDLIILQYGGNAVPYISNGYARYGKLFYDQLMRLKSIVPGVPILVIGLADMSIKEKGHYITYPVLPKVRDALKEAAFKAGCAYWDMFEAMGGENSMPSWVFADPPLASTDFVHFNHRGAKLIAQMFYNALMKEYNLYLESTGQVNLAQNEQ
jgi:lysophospholipase L1-like esterase